MWIADFVSLLVSQSNISYYMYHYYKSATLQSDFVHKVFPNAYLASILSHATSCKTIFFQRISTKADSLSKNKGNSIIAKRYEISLQQRISAFSRFHSLRKQPFMQIFVHLLVIAYITSIGSVSYLRILEYLR